MNMTRDLSRLYIGCGCRDYLKYSAQPLLIGGGDSYRFIVYISSNDQTRQLSVRYGYLDISMTSNSLPPPSSWSDL